MSERNPTKKIYGLIGYPVKHSLSAAMHNAAFKHVGINAEYRLFEVKPEELEGFLLKDVPASGTTFSAQDIAGFNITIPHKVRAKEILEKKFPSKTKIGFRPELYVQIAGAINTVFWRDNKLHYYNTDAPGFLKSLKEDLKFNTEGKNVLIIGCGGAGRSVIAGLGWRGLNEVKKMYIYELSDEIVSSAAGHFAEIPYLKGRYEFISYKQVPEVIKDCQLLINATPVGMKDSDGSVTDKELLHKDLSVYDVIYHRQTQLIKDAKSKGLRWADGIGMLLWQGVLAFELWTGKPAPIEIMRKALEKELAECQR